MNKTAVRKPKWNLPKTIQPKATKGNKHSKQKLANNNQKANTVIERRQKTKKSKLLDKSDNNQKTKTLSTRNETKLSLRRTAEKNNKSTPSKGKQESQRNTRRHSQKKDIRLGQDEGAIEKHNLDPHGHVRVEVVSPQEKIIVHQRQIV